jgi:hypothetical protein
MGALLKPETFLVLGLPIGSFLAASFPKKSPACDTSTPRSAPWPASTGTPSGRLPDPLRRPAGRRLRQQPHHLGHHAALLSGMIFGAGVFASGIFTAKMIRKAADMSFIYALLIGVAMGFLIQRVGASSQA